MFKYYFTLKLIPLRSKLIPFKVKIDKCPENEKTRENVWCCYTREFGQPTLGLILRRSRPSFGVKQSPETCSIFGLDSPIIKTFTIIKLLYVLISLWDDLIQEGLMISKQKSIKRYSMSKMKNLIEKWLQNKNWAIFLAEVGHGNISLKKKNFICNSKFLAFLCHRQIFNFFT